MSTMTTVYRPGNVQRIRRGETPSIDILGIHMEWKITERNSGHQYSLFEMTVPPGAGVPLHHHAEQETFWVVNGEAEFGRVVPEGPECFGIEPGDTVNVPSWAFHGFRNPGARNTRILLTCAAGLETFFQEVGLPIGQAAPCAPALPRRRKSSGSSEPL